MTVGCKLCSGIQAQIKAVEGDIEELKEKEQGILDKIEKIRKEMADSAEKISDAIGKKPSTATLISVCAIAAALFGTIAMIGYLGHQSRMARLEDADVQIRKQISMQYSAIGNRLSGFESSMKKQEPAKPATKK